MSLETFINDCERGLTRIIRLGLLERYTAANLTALSAFQTMSHGALCYVTSESAVYEWDSYSTATANGSTVIASSTLPAGKTNGRWLKIITDWTYGAGGTNLGAKSTGYLRSVEAYSGDDGPEDAITRVYARFPSVLVQWTGDDPKADSVLPGTFYKDTVSFNLMIATSNNRKPNATTQGSPFSGEDPGAYRVIGDLRRLIAGIADRSGISGVERIEFGAARLMYEDLEDRLFIHLMQVRCMGSVEITDEDLEAASIVVQPDLAGNKRDESFDASNYVARGANLDEGEGTGLSRNIVETVAVIGGVAVSVAETAVTFTADSDTYRDLGSDGNWTFTAVSSGAAEPSLTDGLLRVAVTKTDSNSVLSDQALCHFAVPYGDSFTIS